MSGTVIVGAGHAGIELADALRKRDQNRRITVFGTEQDLPYQRPPLSKDYLCARDPQPLPLRGNDFYPNRGIKLQRGVGVRSIDAANRKIATIDGSSLGYDDLVIATGSAHRRLAVPGAGASGVHYLRTADDARRLHEGFNTAGRAVVIGAGFIGLEFAAMARKRGIEVTVIEFGPRVLMRALSPTTAEYVTNMHRDSGVRFAFSTEVTEIVRYNGTLTGVLTTDGRIFDADLVVVGIGADAQTQLAVEAGLPVNNGVVVDEFLQTATPHIWAIGDCASYRCAHSSTLVRRESVQNAVEQARTLAQTLTGNPTTYRAVPWFWSNQGLCRIQIVGASGPVDRTVVRGDIASGKFSTLCFREDRLVSVESINQPRVHLVARRALAEGPITEAELAASRIASIQPPEHSGIPGRIRRPQ